MQESTALTRHSFYLPEDNTPWILGQLARSKWRAAVAWPHSHKYVWKHTRKDKQRGYKPSGNTGYPLVTVPAAFLFSVFCSSSVSPLLHMFSQPWKQASYVKLKCKLLHLCCCSNFITVFCSTNTSCITLSEHTSSHQLKHFSITPTS